MKQKLIAVLSIATACLAQDKPQVVELQEALMQYQAESAEYTDRIEKLVSELKKADANIESSIAKTLKFAQQYTDSADTRERLMKSKESMLKDLTRSVARYSDLQKDMTREMARDQNYIKEDMLKVHDWADAKITLRIQQITAITTSLGGYDFYSSGVAHDDDNADSERRKRLAENAVENKKDIILKMRRGIKDLTERSTALEKELANPRSKRSVEEINIELTAVNEKLALLENSIEDIYSAEAYGKRVDKTASREIEKEMRNRVGEIKSNSASFFKNFDALMHLLRMQKSSNINIEKYEFTLEQLKAKSE